MKVILENETQLVVRCDRGENALEEIVAIAHQKRIEAGYFYAIGAVQELTLSYYNLASKNYEDHEIIEDLEIISILGTIATLNGEVALHAHGSFGDRNLTVRAGHIKKLVVSATCEVVITKLQGKIERGFSDETGLNLMQ